MKISIIIMKIRIIFDYLKSLILNDYKSGFFSMLTVFAGFLDDRRLIVNRPVKDAPCEFLMA